MKQMTLIFLVSFLILILTATAQPLPNMPAAILMQRESPDNRNGYALYLADIEGHQRFLLNADTVTRDGSRLWIADNQFLDLITLDTVQAETDSDSIELSDLDSGSLVPPRPVNTSLPDYETPDLYLITGENNNFINLYQWDARQLIPLTDVLSLFSDSTISAPILSASVEFIAWRPVYPGFLYRARLRDASGTDYNRLFLYEMDSRTSQEMPFFGTTPAWSPDGLALAGSRLNTELPLYEIWISYLDSGDERQIAPGCNVQWSPDGIWLAYDEHVDVHWQSYIDCFANGQVEAFNLETGEKIRLSEGLNGYIQLAAWLIPGADE